MLTRMKKTRKTIKTVLGLELSRFFLEGDFRPAMELPHEKGRTWTTIDMRATYLSSVKGPGALSNHSVWESSARWAGKSVARIVTEKGINARERSVQTQLRQAESHPPIR